MTTPPFPIKADILAQQISVKSAANPSLWLCAGISLPLFILAAFTNGWLSVAFFIVAIFPVGAFLISYFYLLFRSPEYLRSEDYQLRMNSMRLLGDKDNPLQADADDVVSLIPNPSLPSPKNENQ